MRFFCMFTGCKLKSAETIAAAFLHGLPDFGGGLVDPSFKAAAVFRCADGVGEVLIVPAASGNFAGSYQILKPYAVAVDQAIFADFGVICTVPGSGKKWACAEKQAVLPVPIAANASFQNGITYLFYLHAVLTLQKRGAALIKMYSSIKTENVNVTFWRIFSRLEGGYSPF